ncbi:MAG: hypothetical protein QW453_03200 [Thermoprotei archaeon]
MSYQVGGKVSRYVSARIRAFSDNINDAASRVQSEGVVAAAVQIVASGLGILPITQFGQEAQRRREAARKELSS